MPSPRSNDKPLSRPIKISVEGNIGSGKSTFLNYFKQFSFVETYTEPLDKWRDVQGHNLLELLYEDMAKWSTTFQSYVQLTRTQVQTTSPKSGVKIQIFERSVQNNRYCFMENAYNNGFILPAQYSVLCKWYEWIQENVDISLDLIVYLKTNPEVVHKRVISRNRAEEKISLDYMESLHKAHERWLMDPNQKIPVVVVDANKCFDDVIQSCQKQLPALFTDEIPGAVTMPFKFLCATCRNLTRSYLNSFQ
ncbi:hypothetical protein RUM43_001005 [Polyplax serrata]|uniref:Deoxynucleoside kinase domain-containing protein n=1 Tax=Polyplax serrata TaxID=468196 RepID=A0AAN8SFJ5_POLSC